MKFSDLSEGDVVSFELITDSVGTRDMRTLTLLTDPVEREDAGMVISTLEQPHLLFEKDGWAVTNAVYATGLPKNAPFVTWVDDDRHTRVASVFGHPGNKVWEYNGSRISSSELRELIGDATVGALDPRQ